MLVCPASLYTSSSMLAKKRTETVLKVLFHPTVLMGTVSAGWFGWSLYERNKMRQARNQEVAKGHSVKSELCKEIGKFFLGCAGSYGLVDAAHAYGCLPHYTLVNRALALLLTVGLERTSCGQFNEALQSLPEHYRALVIELAGVLYKVPFMYLIYPKF